MALFVSELITQAWAMVCIQVPVSEIHEPRMKRRNGPARITSSARCANGVSAVSMGKTDTRGHAQPQCEASGRGRHLNEAEKCLVW